MLHVFFHTPDLSMTFPSATSFSVRYCASTTKVWHIYIVLGVSDIFAGILELVAVATPQLDSVHGIPASLYLVA